MGNIPTDYYVDAIDLSNVEGVEHELKELLDRSIQSVHELEGWLDDELKLSNRIDEVYGGHSVDFYRDTEDEEKKQKHLRDQSEIQPLLIRYSAEFDKKFCECPFTAQLNDADYGLMKRVRATNLELFREENVALQVREQELVTEYQALTGGLMVEWEGEQKPLPVVQALIDSPDRSVRQKAWEKVAEAYASVRPRMQALMGELVQLRHQMAVNAGFANYRDYVFRQHNREYNVDDCRRFHSAVAKYIVPVWDHIADDIQNELGVDTFRPWDNSNNSLSGPPFENVQQLMDGVYRILCRLDDEFAAVFQSLRDGGLLDLEGRAGKRPGGFCMPFPVSKTSFVFANISPSFFALIALIHEMGHALNNHYQFKRQQTWVHHRAEIAELFSHSMELLCLDKLDEFYRSPAEHKAAMKQRLRRSLGMLMGPLAGDVFQHWMYEHPDHTAEERDAAFLRIQKQYFVHPVDCSGYEEQVGQSWIGTIHYFAYPFYNIEYSMAELGAIQVLRHYRSNPDAAIVAYKRGASADYRESIANVYEQTGVRFDFSDAAIEQSANFLRDFWKTLD